MRTCTCPAAGIHDYNGYVEPRVCYVFIPADNGYANPTTNDSVIEGFAEFNAMLIAEYYGSLTPYLYNVRTTVLNLEEDYQVWGNMGPSPSRTVDTKSSSLYEELAVAGILWDLHDIGKEIDLTTSKVYPESTDNRPLA